MKSNGVNSGLIATIIILSIVVIAVVLIIVFSVSNRKKNNAVEKNSGYLKGFKELNEKYQFITVSSNSSRVYQLNSKRQFDTFDYHKKTKEYIANNVVRFNNIVESIEKNRRLFELYKSEIKNLRYTSDEKLAKEHKMKLSSFVKREVKLSKKYYKHPTTDHIFTITWEYTSPAGRNHYEDSRTYKFDLIKKMVSVHDIPAKQSFYDTIKQRIKQYETNLVTINDIEDLDD